MGIKNIIILLFSIFILLVIIYLIITYLRNRNTKSLKLDIFLVKIPQYSDKEKEELSQDFIAQTLGRIEGLFSALSSLKADKTYLSPRQDIFSFEIVVKHNTISFYVATPHKYRDFLLQQLQAIYPKIYFEEVKDYNIFAPIGLKYQFDQFFLFA